MRDKGRSSVKFVKENPITIIGWLIGLGILLGSFTALKNDVADVKAAQHDYPQVKWQSDQNTRAIEAIRFGDKERDQAIAALTAKTDVINSKLDEIKQGIEELKKRQGAK